MTQELINLADPDPLDGLVIQVVLGRIHPCRDGDMHQAGHQALQRCPPHIILEPVGEQTAVHRVQHQPLLGMGGDHFHAQALGDRIDPLTKGTVHPVALQQVPIACIGQRTPPRLASVAHQLGRILKPRNGGAHAASSRAASPAATGMGTTSRSLPR